MTPDPPDDSRLRSALRSLRAAASNLPASRNREALALVSSLTIVEEEVELWGIEVRDCMLELEKRLAEVTV